MSEQKNLPSIKDIYSEKVVLAKKNDLNVLVNQEPKQEWTKVHPMFKNVKYIPIERVEWLLTTIFIDWNVEVKTVQLIANSVVVTVRLYYRDPVTGEMNYQDGIGASPLQTDKDAGATDWTRIKSDAVMKAAPSAESFAVKDAAEKIGKLFGKDLNRADKIMYDSLMDKFQSDVDRAQVLINLIDKLPEVGLQAMYKDDCQKARKAGKFTPEFIEETIKKVQRDLS